MGEKEKIKNEDGGQKKDKDKRAPVVLKTEVHCEGCASKIIKFIRSFDGVDTAMVAEGHKIIVVGDVDAAELRELVEHKIHKKVELISAPPKKDNADGNKEKKATEAKHKSDEKKSQEKQLPVTTAEFKVHLHCDGCIQKIYKTVTKTKGYEELKMDGQKDVVTVKGAIDMKALAEVLKKQLKRDVQIVEPKKEGDKKEADKSSGKEAAGGGGVKIEGNDMSFQLLYPVNVGPSGLMGDPFPHYIAPYPSEMFSDENPNACSVM